jgi:glucose-6-phosphate dehydrogenase assembly protein OpcA
MSAARALVIPNLPVQVWWPGSADLTSPLFQQIVEVGDRIIVDSAQFTSPLSTLAHYADQAEVEHGTVGFVDLNWRRLEPWRLVLAQFFDAVEERRFLSYVESITISYRQPLYGSAGGLAAALLLLGWFASRLGWSAPDRPLSPAQDLQILEFNDGERDVRVELRRVEALEGDSSLTAVELHCRFDQRTARYLVERSDDEARSIVEREDVRRETQVHLAVPDEAKLLAEELAGFGRDRIYEEALHLIRVLDRGAPTTRGTL